MVPAAELRIYRSLDSFDEAERARLRRRLAKGDRAPRYVDAPTAPGVGFLAPAGDGLRAIVDEGQTFVSPDHGRLVLLAGILANAYARPFEEEIAFVDKRQVRRAKRELRRLRRRDPGLVASAMTHAWQVPAQWFVLFDDSERRLVTEPSLSLTYRTTCGRAVRRLEKAIPIVRAAEFAPSAEPLMDLYRWVANVPPRSLLVLDYGGLAPLLRWDDLDDDHGARDAWDMLAALARDDRVTAMDLYGAVAGRWADLRGRASWN